VKRIFLLAALVVTALTAFFYWREPSGPHVTIEDVRLGDGAALETGETVTVHYVAKVRGGPVYSETRKLGQPFTFVVGKGQVLPGWEQGVRGMRQGGLRRLTIPPELAYGDRGAPPLIPPGATLEVEIELLRVSAP
jgi:FKBP-type peptidyl-prolyl cis-trans isomerase